MQRSPMMITVIAAGAVVTACAKQSPTPLPLPLRRYVGCYAIRGVGTHTGQATWRTLRLTAESYDATPGFTDTAYQASFLHDMRNYYWFIRGDTLNVRPKTDVGMVNGWVDSLNLWPRGQEYAGLLRVVTHQIIGGETDWDVLAGRIWCEM